jgi:hypothetical protein
MSATVEWVFQQIDRSLRLNGRESAKVIFYNKVSGEYLEVNGVYYDSYRRSVVITNNLMPEILEVNQ